MQYDPVKYQLGKWFNASPFLRILFYRLMDILLLRTWHIRKELKKWKKNAGNNSYILDAGSGFGQYTYYLSQINPAWKIKGVDVKQEQIDDCNGFFEKINKSANVTFEIADLTTLACDSCYDLILSVDVMEHIKEDVQVFKNFFRCLKPGGMLLISTPSDQGGSDVHDHGSEHSFIDEHVRDGYTIRDIEEKLQAAGFTNVVSSYSYGRPGSISWRLSMKYPIRMINLSRLLFVILPVYYLITFPFALLLNQLDVSLRHKSGTGLIVKAVKK